MSALVIFSGKTDIRFLKILRRGFRHCLMIERVQGGCILYDPLSHQTVMRFLDGACLESLRDSFAEHGFTIVQTQVREAPRRLRPISVFSCVEAVKRRLGLTGGRMHTPWQLYRTLMTEGHARKKNLDNLSPLRHDDFTKSGITPASGLGFDSHHDDRGVATIEAA